MSKRLHLKAVADGGCYVCHDLSHPHNLCIHCNTVSLFCGMRGASVVSDLDGAEMHRWI